MEYLLETQHLRLRPFETGDAQRLYENHTEAEMARWIPNERYADLAEARDAICFYRAGTDSGKLPFVLAVEDKCTGELIGDAGINEVDGENGSVELGYSICRKHSGKGLATELAAAMAAFAADRFSVRTLYGRVLRGNIASVRVL